MKNFVISLNRTPQRLDIFKSRNNISADFQIFDAIDGEAIHDRLGDYKDSFDPLLKYSKGAFGCALSHRGIWEIAANTKSAVTVCEDDAILHSNFSTEQSIILSSLPEWDFVMWGWNFDAILVTETLPKLSRCLMRFDQNLLRSNWQTYISTPVHPTLMKLITGLGTLCYSMSPTGAQKFLTGCFPLKDFIYSVPVDGEKIPNYGIDVAMNTIYPSTGSFVSFPPLAISLNDHSQSTIQR